MIANLAALGAALCWATSGFVAHRPVRLIGPLAFNRLRMCIVFLGLALVTTLLGRWGSLDAQGLILLALSGGVGIFLGDTALFWALGRLGPRRNSVIYATNAPLTALLGWLVLSEELGPWTAGGIALVTTGVMLAVFFRSTAAPTHDWETVRGRLVVGIGICLLAALCQAGGSIIAKPAMMAGADPVAASTVRVGTAACLLLATGLLPTGLLPGQAGALRAALQPRILLPTAISGFLGLGLGMTFLLIGLAYGKAGVVATLSATSPILVLPLQWALTRQRPGLGGWVGALVAVMGVALIVNR